jgi:hypothetical protein
MTTCCAVPPELVEILGPSTSTDSCGGSTPAGRSGIRALRRRVCSGKARARVSCGLNLIWTEEEGTRWRRASDATPRNGMAQVTSAIS